MNSQNMLLSYWSEFKNALKAKLDDISSEKLFEAWREHGKRTNLYSNDLIPGIADRLNLIFEKEFCNVDYTLCVRSGNHNVPLIFIESENNADSSSHEIRKLCSVCAPLKVLFTVVEWSDEPDYWNHGGRKKEFIDKWNSIINEHTDVWAQPHIIGFVVGEGNGDVLRFYSFALSANGRLIDSEDIIMEKHL